MVTIINSAVIAFIILTPIVLFLIKGIRIKAYFDLERCELVTDAFIFGSAHVLKYKAFECNGYIYGQLNSRDLKKLRFSDKNNSEKDNEEVKGDSSGKFTDRATRLINALTDMFDSFPKIRLKTLRAYFTVGTGNSMQTSLIASSIATLMNIVSIATYEKIKVKDADIAVYPNFRHENTVLTVDLDTGAGLTGILIKLALLKVRLSAMKRKERAEKA